MYKFEIILKGGLKGCCSTYSAAQLNELTKSWFEKEPDIHLQIKDIEVDEWEGDEVADYGYKMFGDRFFPLAYLNGKLISAGFFPEKKGLQESLEYPRFITKANIDRAKAQAVNHEA